MNKHPSSYCLIKILIAGFIFLSFTSKAESLTCTSFNVARRDSVKKDTTSKEYGWDLSAEFAGRQIYYGSYDTAKIRSYSPEIDYLFKSGLLLSLTTVSFSHQAKKINELGLGVAWQHYINEDWYFDIAYSRFFSNEKPTQNANETSVILDKRSVEPNDFSTCMENDNDIINTSLRLDLLTGSSLVADLVGDLQLSHDFDILYKEGHYELSIGLRNDFYFGSVNSISYISLSRQTLRRGIVTKVTAIRTGGALYDNAALPITLQLKRFTFKPELDYDVPIKKFVYTESSKTGLTSTYLPGTPLFYFVATIDYNLQKKARHHK